MFGWKEVPLVGGGPKDGGSTQVRGTHREQFVRFLDPALDPAKGVNPGDMLHVYEHVKREDGSEVYEYRGPQVHKAEG